MLSAMKSLINDTPLAWAFVVDKSVVLRCIHCFKAFTRRLEIYILLEKMRLILSLFSLSPEEHSSESIMHFDFFYSMVLVHQHHESVLVVRATLLSHLSGTWCEYSARI